MWFTQGEHASLSATASAPQQVAETMNRDHTCYFVGSNAEISVDSRNFGPIHMHAVLGKVVFPQVTLQPSNAQLNQTPL